MLTGSAYKFVKSMIANPSELSEERNGAVEKTRTSTRVTGQRPQRCASTSSATTAQ